MAFFPTSVFSSTNFLTAAAAADVDFHPCERGQ